MEKQYLYKDYEKFFHCIFGKAKYIIHESDMVFSDGKIDSALIYYTKEIYDLLNTKAVKRLARIFQLGTKILSNEKLSHTRLEHSKGTYYRTLNMLMRISEDTEIKENMTNEKMKQYFIAELIRALLHDLGHGPFSHTLETVCRLPKGFHEIIGKRIIEEDEEVRSRLEAISPDLPNSMIEVEKRNFLGLNSLFEGQFDVDRADFVLRDMVFFGSTRNQEIREIIEQLLCNFKLKQIEVDGKRRIVPVFDNSQMTNMERFLKIRNEGYKHIYYSDYGKRGEHIFRKFADELLETDESYELKDYLGSLLEANPQSVDLQQYMKYDDIEYIRAIIEIYKNTKNERLKKLALCCIPKEEALDYLYYGAMVSVEQVDENGNAILSEKDRKLFEDIIEIRKKVGNKDFSEEYFQIIRCKSRQELSRYISEIKNITGINDENELDRAGVFFDISQNSTYKAKKGEEIYIEGQDGKVYEYSTHPERKQPIDNFENIILIIDNDQISRVTDKDIDEQIRNVFQEHIEI